MEVKRISSYRNQRGSSLVELALLLPVLTLVAFGVIEVGRYAEFSITVANAARAGLQYGIQSFNNANDQAGIRNAASYDAPNTNLQVNPALVCYCSGTPIACGNPCLPPSTRVVYLNVTATGTFTPILSYPGLPTLTAISTTAQMRVPQ